MLRTLPVRFVRRMQSPVAFEVTAVAKRARAQIALIGAFPSVNPIMATSFGTCCAGLPTDVAFVGAVVALS